MKKAHLAASVIVLVISLILGSFDPVQASSGWPNPTVTPLTGDTTFDAIVTNPSHLAGSFITASGYPAPLGFTEGDLQFGGNALVLNGISSGSQKLCFTIPAYRYGWRGSIYQWFDSKWVKLITSITNKKEASTLACTTIYGNGTYALLVGFNPKFAPRSGTVEECTADLSFDWTSFGSDQTHGIGVSFAGVDLPSIGQSFTWKITDLASPGLVTPTSGSGIITGDPAFPVAEIHNLHTGSGPNGFWYTLRIYTPECHSYTFLPN